MTKAAWRVLLWLSPLMLAALLLAMHNDASKAAHRDNLAGTENPL